MIRYFRENIQGNFAKVFIALICVPFVLFGVDSFFTSSQNPNVAKVNGDSIKLAETQAEIQRLLSERKRQLGDRFDAINFDEQGLRPQAVERLIRRKIIEQAVAEHKFAVSSQAIDQQIVKQTIFHSDGKFSANLYKNILRSNNLSPRSYKTLVENDITVSQLSAGVSKSEFLTVGELANYIKFEYQDRDLSYIVFDRNVEANKVSIEEESIQNYYSQNLAEFMTDETVNLSYVELKLEDFYASVTEQDINQAYDQQIADMTLATQRKAAHILISDKVNVKAVQERLAQGESFSVLAAELSEDQGSANDGGVLGYTGGELFPPEFEAALALLALDEVSGPIETEAGVHFIKLLDVKAGDVPRLEDLRAGLETELQKLQALPAFEESLERLKDLAFDSDSIADLAKELQLGVQRSGHFSQGGANSGLFSSASLVNTAFSAELRLDKRLSDVQEVTAEHYIVAQLHDRNEPQQKTIDTVSGLITSTLKNEAVIKALNYKRDQIIMALGDGGNFETLAMNYGLSVTNANAVTRRGMSGANRDVLLAGFNINTNQVPAHESYTRSDGSIAIVNVRSVNYGRDGVVDEQTLDGLKTLLSRSYGNEAFTNYDAALNEAATIKLM